uniref:Protein ORFa in retron Ec67 n=29 Tax=root TaxID=1 RepID=YR7A_ECOLX|nr:RecName: Full=Protein ORFa in retron Ec67 [Escherichia coli]AAA23391.1 unknown [Escherichia coli]
MLTYLFCDPSISFVPIWVLVTITTGSPQANRRCCIMTPNISITLNTPHVTIERYSELTGLSIDTINDMLADGRIPRHRLRKDKKREKVMINLAALTVDALTDCNVVFN